MKLLLVVPKMVATSYGFTNFPIGMSYISASLKEAGYDVVVLDLNNYYSFLFNISLLQMLLKRKITDINPDIVCTGGLSADYDIIKAIIDVTKAINPNLVTIIGGGCVSSEPELIMENIHSLDFGVLGEGDITIVDLVDKIMGKARDYSAVDGIIFRNGNKLITTHPRKPIEDLDSLPYPDYEGFNILYYIERQTLTDLNSHPCDNPKVFEITASRSCPFKCSFCFHPVGEKYRKRSIDSVISEIKYLINSYGINYLLINDELLANNKKWISDFCNKIQKLNIKWQAQLRVDAVDKEILLLLKNSGCIFISYGLESASPAVLKSMKKHITIKQIENALKLTKENNFQIQGNFIFGDKAETIETMVETLNWWFNHKEYRITLSQLIPYPGTALYKYAIENKMFKENRIEYIKNGCAKLHTINLTQIPDTIYSAMIKIAVWHLRISDLMPGEFIECRKIGCDPYQGFYYSAVIKCPYCKTHLKFKRIHTKYVKFSLKAYSRFIFGCMECNQRMTFMTPEVEEKLFDIVKTEHKNKIVIIGSDIKTERLLKNSFLAKKYCVAILDDPQKYPVKSIHNIPIIDLAGLENNNVQFDCILKISQGNQYLNDMETILKRKEIPIFDISDELKFLDHYENQEQTQNHFNYVSQKIATAKNSNNMDEASFLLLELLGNFPNSASVHLNLADISFQRKDYQLFFDACYTLASVISASDFENIKQFLINSFNYFLQNNLLDLADEVIKVFVYNNPNGNPGFILSLERAILERRDLLIQ